MHRTFNQVPRMECLEMLRAWMLEDKQCFLLTFCCTGMFESLKYFVSLHPRSEAGLRIA